MPLLGRINYHLFRIIKSRKFVGISYQLYYAVFKSQELQIHESFLLITELIPQLYYFIMQAEFMLNRIIKIPASGRNE